MYIKDYNEVVILSEYIGYDIQSKGVSSFNSDKYIIEIEKGEQISYRITYSRNTIFVIGWFKSIKYDGIV